MTGAAEVPAAAELGEQGVRHTESSPLLGGPGDVVQRPGRSLVSNLYTGTAWLAQVGVLLVVVAVWSAIFRHSPFLPLFSPHPLLQSLGVLVVVQAILVLQPTSPSSPDDKVRGARVHAVLQLLSFALFVAGTGLIEANKIRSHGVHLHSAHGILGVVTTVVLVGQYLFGFLIWAVPVGAFGSVDRAKSLWKHHRWVGYVALLPLLLATVVTATSTAFNVNVLDIRPWAMLAASGLVFVGVYPRIHGRKLGLRG